MFDTSPGEHRVDHVLALDGYPALVRVLECRRLLEPAYRISLRDLDEVILARGTTSRIERVDRSVRLVVADPRASRRHAAIRHHPDGWHIEDLSSRNGTFVNTTRIARAALTDGDLIEIGGSILMFVEDDVAMRQPVVVTEAPGDTAVDRALRTLNAELDRRFQQVRKIAPSTVPVLVRGETGTGKEVVARAIHDASGRRGPFVAVNCGALPRNLLESELFGHRRGAFSGATEEREGLVRRANHGTLFLDEIAELPPDSQVALLRVLQEGEVRAVGATDDVKVDVRVIAATHQDLHRRIAANQFRQDLYARIAGFEVTLPPLRQRREDLGMLIAAIVPRVAAHPEQVTLHHLAARMLLAHSWPLNIRELEQALRAAIALAEDGEVRIEHLPRPTRDPELQPILHRRAGDDALRARLIELLRESDGNVAAVGRALHRAPIQIRRWCTRFQIDLASFRPGRLPQ